MTYDVQVRRAAEHDIAEAQVWYEEQRSGLGDEFRSEVSQVIERLAKTPLIYVIVYKMFAEQSFTGFHISSGIEFSAN